MKLNFSLVLDLIFPPTADEKTLSLCSTDTFVNKLEPAVHAEVLALSSFKDPQIRCAVHLNKFHNNKKASILLSALLQKWIETLDNHEYIIIPAPLSKERYAKRGHNQVTTIARTALAPFPHLHLREDILYKSQHTRPQTELTKQERLQNLRGVFALHANSASLLRGKRLILLDDVITTGATLKEARSVLLTAKPHSVQCIAMAH